VHMKKHVRYAIIAHIYYDSEVEDLLNRLSVFNAESSIFLFNIATNNTNRTKELIAKTISNYILQIYPDKGRDIGAKLFLLNALMQLNVEPEYVLIIHDKKSPHLPDSHKWKDELLRIIDKKNLPNIPKIFEDPGVGIVCSIKYIEVEYNEQTNTFRSSNSRFLKEIIKENKLKIRDYSFVAGNIFFIRFKALSDFFKNKNRDLIDIISTLENNNALDFHKGTRIHSWERVMSWIATSQDYQIYGI